MPLGTQSQRWATQIQSSRERKLPLFVNSTLQNNTGGKILLLSQKIGSVTLRKSLISRTYLWINVQNSFSEFWKKSQNATFFKKFSKFKRQICYPIKLYQLFYYIQCILCEVSHNGSSTQICQLCVRITTQLWAPDFHSGQFFI